MLNLELLSGGDTVASSATRGVCRLTVCHRLGTLIAAFLELVTCHAYAVQLQHYL